jgi:hypothetical protein
MSDVPSASLKNEIRRLFQDLADALPPGAASLEIVEGSRPGEGLTIALVPSSPTAAQIGVRVDNALEVTLGFGKGSIYEVPAKGKRYTDSPCVEEVRLLCLAVINGLFTETIWLKGDEVVQARGEVRIGDKVVPHFWREILTNPLQRRRKERIMYTPFVIPGSG